MMQNYTSSKFLSLAVLSMLVVGCGSSSDNSAPVIDSDGGAATAELTAAENQTAVTAVTYTDADQPADSIIYSLSGADAGLFSISGTGVLTFNTAPDFENPVDADTDGRYEVSVAVADQRGGVDSQAIVVTVTDEIEIVPLATGLQTMEWQGSASGCETVCERSYFVQLPADYDPSAGVSVSAPAVAAAAATELKPLLIALHGTGGTYKRWTDSELGYDLVDYVGDEAIMVFPNALADANGSQQWSFAYDFDFFLDLLAELDRRGLRYDPDRIFVTGHSSGGGMAHEIGCRLGDVVRAIAPSAGTLISTNCVGSVAVLMSQGRNDQLVKFDIATGARRFWTLYNGYSLDAKTPGEVSPCVDYSLLGSANTPYPVYWCEHTEGSIDDFSGHRWASFAGQAVWTFFSSLPPEPADKLAADPPPGGGNERAQIPSDTTITFTLKYPDNINTPLDGAITLYPAEYLDNPTFAIPSVFLNPVFAVGTPAPGDLVTYKDVPISFFVFSGDPVAFPSDWTLSISVYVQGGTRPTPTAGVDHQVQLPITFTSKSDPVLVEGELELVPARCFIGCD